ncbi:MAG: glycosyltransferase [Myxococcota bacterium]|nr:glycosyltransferase [Myxococcota bacterium]
MKIALAASGSRGDVYPVLALGATLERHGHDVRVCATVDFADEVAAAGLDFRPVGSSVRSLLERNARAIHAGPRATLEACRSELRALFDEQFAALPEAIDGVDLVIGAGVQVAGPSVAEAAGVPYRLLAYCPVLLPSREHPPFVVSRQGLPGWLNAGLWWLARAGLGAVMRGPLDRHRRELGLPRLGDVYRHFVSERPILAVDAGIARAPADSAFPVQQVRCLHPFEPEPLPAKLESFLASGSRPVYIGFGSMPDARPGETTRTLVEGVERAGLRAVIGGGWAGLGEGALPDSIHVAGPVSHAALFPRVACVVHHGGAGTTTTAARAGVPQLIVPHLLDQYWFAHRMWQLGAAPVSIRRPRLSAESLAEWLRSLVDNDFVRARAAALGSELRAAIAEPLDPAPLLRA